MILLDTSTLIDFLRQKDKQATWLYQLAHSQNSLAASIITHTELHAGKSIWEKPTAKKELATIFSGIRLIPLTEAISKLAGKYHARYQLDLIDAVIAATAATSKHTLATFNQKHFQKIPGLKLVTPPA